jgi:nucleoside 2-deoxyribosyltransferase
LDGHPRPLTSEDLKNLSEAHPSALQNLAAPLFTAAEQAFNRALAADLERLGYRVFLLQRDVPQRDVPKARGRDRTRRIFAACRRGLRQANCVVAVCDGPVVDDGTAWEIGYAVALGKPVYALRTDSRAVARDGRVNLMIQESARRLFRSVPALLATLRRGGRVPRTRRRATIGGTRRRP